MREKITPDGLAALTVSLLPVLYFYPATFGPLVLTPADGIIFNAPLRATAANIALGGSLPLWNPYIFGGMPLLAAAQGGLLFPLNWLFLVFDAPTAMNLAMLSTYAVAALGSYLYARRSGASVAGASLTALAWQFSGFMLAQIGHMNIVQTAALLPWTLWALDGFGSHGGRARAFAIAALVMLQVFAGHQQTLAYSLLVFTAYAVFRAFAEKGAERRRRYLASLAFAFVGLIASAAQILPTYELLRNSIRAAPSYDFFTSFSMPRSFLWTFFAPYVQGGGDGRLFRAPYVGTAFYAEYIAYAGLLTLALASLALILRRKGGDYFWAAVAAGGLLLALGRFLPFDLYAVLYHVPVINLFRVPARHLMEVDLALAVLAGRGLTALAESRGRARATTYAAIVSVALLALACLAVTVGRPDEFILGRRAPVSILRAPELFMPAVVAVLSGLALLAFARARRGASALLFAVLFFDLALWGHASGWRRAPTEGDLLWREPGTVRFLREREGSDQGRYRILTVLQAFDPTAPVAVEQGDTTAFILELQPNTYMMHGVENAAGYDGFGLGRYSRLADDMKLWGDLPEPQKNLTGESRAFDVLNVRYLLVPNQNALQADRELDEELRSEAATRQPATVSLGGYAFANEDLGAPSLERGGRFIFRAPNVPTESVALLTNLSWSTNVPDGTVVGRVRLYAKDGREFVLDVRAGEHASEWAYDRDIVRASARHRRATVGTSFPVEDGEVRYEGHTYVGALALPEPATITGGEIEVAEVEGSPNLILDVKRVSLNGDGRVVPLSPAWIRGAPPRETEGGKTNTGEIFAQGERWRRVGEEEYVTIYENARALPRVWLATEVYGEADEIVLQTIRTGKLPNGSEWNPRKKALVEPSQTIGSVLSGEENPGEAKVLSHEPNRVEIEVEARVPSVLVLSENHYPGWRASVDGRETEIMRVNYNMRGVALGAGRQRVSFYYSPRSVWAGALISTLTLAGLALWTLRWPGVKLLRRRTKGRT